MAQTDVRLLNGPNIGQTVTYDSATGDVTGELTSVAHDDCATHIAIDGENLPPIAVSPVNTTFIEIEIA